MNPAPSTLLGKIFTQVIAILFFFVVPIVITLVVPLTDLEFHKTDGNTSVKVKRYVLLFIPWKNEEALNVKSVRADITSEKIYQDTSENRRKGNEGISVSTGQLVFISEGSEVKVQAEPELAKEISKEFEQFLVSESVEPLKFSVYASWSLSYILGGVATFFAALYIFGALVSIVIYPFKK
jgi:ABC-type sugar transport system permease subunit